MQRDDSMPWRVKPLGELMFLVLVLQRHRIQVKRTRPLAEFVAREVERFDWHMLAGYDPSAATPLAMLADFAAIQVRTAPFERSHFENLLVTGYFNGMDRVPYRDMDLAYSLWRIGLEASPDVMEPMFAATAFGRKQHLARYSIDDIYSLTHALFYLTDIGQRPLDETLDPSLAGRLRRELVALTAIMIRADNVDVLGELLLNWMFCGLKADALEQKIFDAGVERVLGALTPSGALPSTHRSRRRALAGEAGFHELYHTTLVGALMFSLLDARR